MQKFEYRIPRIHADLPMTFVASTGVCDGRCTDLSTEGLGANVAAPVCVGTIGSLTLHSPSGAIELFARVTYAQENRLGLAFIFRFPDEHHAIEQFLERLTLCSKS